MAGFVPWKARILWFSSWKNDRKTDNSNINVIPVYLLSLFPEATPKKRKWILSQNDQSQGDELIEIISWLSSFLP